MPVHTGALREGVRDVHYIFGANSYVRLLYM